MHPSLNSYSRLEDHYNILDDVSYASQGRNVYAAQISDEGQELSKFIDLSENGTGLLNIAHFSQMFYVESTKTTPLLFFFHHEVKKPTLNA